MSADLLFATLMMIIVMGYTATIASDRFDMVSESQRLAEARSLAENVAGAINQVYAGGEGHTIKIKMPPSLNNDSSYQLQVNSSGVWVMPRYRTGLAYTVPKNIYFYYDSRKILNFYLYPNREYMITNVKDGGGENCVEVTIV